MLIVGAEVQPLTKENQKLLGWLLAAFWIGTLLVCGEIWLKYIKGTSISQSRYVYSGKNGISSSILFALLISAYHYRTGIRAKPLWLSIVIGAASIFMAYVLLALKCRAVIFSIPFLIIIEIANTRNPAKYRQALAAASFGIGALILIFPTTRDLLINGILLSNGKGNLDSISSGRITLISEAINVFKLSPVFGIGSYYVDCAPIELLVEYGAIGLILALPSYLLIPYILYKRRGSTKTEWNLLLLLCVIFLINSIFEAFTPYGPGLRTFMLWLLAGQVYSDMSGKTLKDFPITRLRI